MPVLTDRDKLAMGGLPTRFMELMQKAGKFAPLAEKLRGRTVVFAVADHDYHLEYDSLRFCLFDLGMLSERSRVMRYSDFFSEPEFQSDILILRSSRIFELEHESLKAAIGSFRAKNPQSAILLSIWDSEVLDKVREVSDSHFIHILFAHFDDAELLAIAARILP